MSNLLLFLLAYVVYIVVWFVINLIVYFFALAFKKPFIFKTLEGLTIFIVWLFNFFAGIGLLWLGWSLLFGGNFIWFLVYIFIGVGIISSLLNIVQMPFYLIPTFFSANLDGKNFNEAIIEAEIIDENGVAVKSKENDTDISVKMAKYFAGFYFLNFLPLIIDPSQREGIKILDYIIKPFLGVILISLLAAIPYIIYSKFELKSFFPADKRYFFIGIWRIGFFISLIITILVIVGNLFI